jgi:cbb3-type cytochrome oxidase subunit 3
VPISEILEGVGPAWVFLLVVLFVGVVYWAFRPRRSRPPDDDPV